MGLLFRRQFLQTPSHKVSESSWTLNALRLRTHAQGRYHYSVSELVQDFPSRESEELEVKGT